jgi:ATP/ADP translocase
VEGENRDKVYQSYLIAKERNHEKLQLSRTVRLFNQIANGFCFNLALHPLVMMKMVHPHLGYLNNFHAIRLVFSDYCRFLEEMIAVSKFFYTGHTLHGNELLSFVFWKAICQKPTMTIP